MAVLRDQPHSADVVAIERSSLFVVSDAASFLRTEPLIALYVAVVQSGRLDAANRSVIAARTQLVANGKQDPGIVAMLDEIGAALHRIA
jgi:CRP/FNR family transcriptional regulator, cyclic AMP receptor protein